MVQNNDFVEAHKKPTSGGCDLNLLNAVQTTHYYITDS